MTRQKIDALKFSPLYQPVKKIMNELDVMDVKEFSRHLQMPTTTLYDWIRGSKKDEDGKYHTTLSACVKLAQVISEKSELDIIPLVISDPRYKQAELPVPDRNSYSSGKVHRVLLQYAKIIEEHVEHSEIRLPRKLYQVQLDTMSVKTFEDALATVKLDVDYLVIEALEEIRGRESIPEPGNLLGVITPPLEQTLEVIQMMLLNYELNTVSQMPREEAQRTLAHGRAVRKTLVKLLKE